MWAPIVERLHSHWRALVGTVGLHGIVYGLVLSTPLGLEPRSSSIVPVIIVERATRPEEDPPPRPERPERDEDRTADRDAPTINVPEPAKDGATPEPLPEADRPIAELSRPPAPTVEPSITTADEPDAIIIDPRYKIPSEPFPETAPSALARVTMSTMCARASLATRPDFCPEISVEDRYFSDTADLSARGGYDPRGDILAAQTAIEQAATAPLERGVNLGFITLKRSARLPTHAEALPCGPVQTGLQGPVDIATDLEGALGSTDGIQCR